MENKNFEVVRSEIIIMYEAVFKALMKGIYDERINSILEKYQIEIDEDGYVITE